MPTHTHMKLGLAKALVLQAQVLLTYCSHAIQFRLSNCNHVLGVLKQNVLEYILWWVAFKGTSPFANFVLFDPLCMAAPKKWHRKRSPLNSHFLSGWTKQVAQLFIYHYTSPNPKK